jgi:DNA primase
MRFSDLFLDEIRARLSTSEVVGRRVKLKKQGREFAGLSPFNAEKTASFFVNDHKGKWFDFSAGKNGDIFTFVMETEGLTFPEAVERLAGEAGVPMPARDPQAEERERERATLYDVVELATKFYEAALQSAEGATARGYLLKRDIGPEIQRTFRIGFALPGRNALKQHLAAKGIDQAQMVEAGLLISGEDIPVSFDRFRDRVIFPITDFRGAVVGFGGRALSSDVPAKYLNSPETPLYHKGSLLYNGATARRAAHDAGTVIVVEGYADVVQMVSAGFTHTVAPLGTALTERQLEILWRMADEPILCFDGDKAGMRAAARAIDLAFPRIKPGKSLLFAHLPAGIDPDDLIRSGGASAMEAVITAARPMIEMLWARETEGETFRTPERRAALEARLGDLTRSIGDESVRHHYVQALRERVRGFFAYDEGSDSSPARSRRDPRARRNFDNRGSPLQRPPVSDRLKRSQLLSGAGAAPLREVVLVITMINHPALIAEHIDQFSELDFSHGDLDRLRSAFLDIAADGGDLTGAEVRKQLKTARMGDLLSRLEAQILAVGHWPALPEADDSDAGEGWRQALTLHHRNRALHRELRDAEAALANDPRDANVQVLAEIQNQLAKNEGVEALIEGFGAKSGRAATGF